MPFLLVSRYTVHFERYPLAYARPETFAIGGGGGGDGLDESGGGLGGGDGFGLGGGGDGVGERRVPLERVRHAAALDPEACRFGVTVEGVVWELRAESEAAMGAWLRALSRYS